MFTCSLFPILWTASWFKARPDVYLWESIRPLDPMPPSYRRRYTNVQAEIGLAGLEHHLATWTANSRAHARVLDAALEPLPGIRIPARPADREHVYYQYCFYAPDRDEFVRRAIRRGVDVETLHVDVCSDLDLFGAPGRAPGATRASEALQLPAYASLDEDEVRAVTATNPARRHRADLANSQLPTSNSQPKAQSLRPRAIEPVEARQGVLTSNPASRNAATARPHTSSRDEQIVGVERSYRNQADPVPLPTHPTDVR